MMTSFLLELLARGAVLSALGAGALLVHRFRPRLGALAWTVSATMILALPLGMAVLPDLQILPSLEAARGGDENIEALPDAAARGAAHGSIRSVETGPEARDGGMLPTREGLPKLSLLWLAGVAVCLAPVLLSLVAEVRFRRSSRAVDPEIAALAGECARSIGLRETPPVLTSDDCQAAFAAGLFRPWVHVPGTIAGADRKSLEGVLLHEFAHIDDRHWAARRLSDLALALHWPNPIVWWANRRLSLVQEFAADDRVISAGYGSTAYSRVLLDAAWRHLEGRRLATMWAPTGLGGRVARILEGGPRPASGGAGWHVLLLMLALLTAGATTRAAPMADSHRHVQVRTNLGHVQVVPADGAPAVDTRIWRRDDAGVVREWDGARAQRVRVEDRGDTLFVEDVEFAADLTGREAWTIDVTVRAGSATSVDVESRYGDVDLAAGGRRIRAVSGIGDVSIELPDREIESLEAFVGEGTLGADLGGVTDELRASVGEGEVRLSLASRAPKRLLHVDGGEAFISLDLPAATNCRLEIDVGSGPILVHPPEKVRRLAVPSGSPLDLLGQIGEGEGGGSCRLEVGEGEVEVRLR